MAHSFTVHMNVAGHRIPSTSWQWGLGMAGDDRRSAPSYGTDIEVPAVVELLDLVASGAVTAEEARDCLNHIASAIQQRMNDEYSRYLSFEESAETADQEQAEKPSAPELDERWVYAVSSEADPKAIKIGVAANIEKRLRSLQIGSASPLQLRWSERGGYPLERHLHAAFSDREISREWFDFRQHSNPEKAIDAEARAFLRKFE